MFTKFAIALTTAVVLATSYAATASAKNSAYDGGQSALQYNRGVEFLFDHAKGQID